MTPFRLQSLAVRRSDGASRLRLRKSAVVLTLSVLSVLFASGLGTLASTSSAAAVPIPWHIATSPDAPASETNQLEGDSCTSSTSCVAVGYYYNGTVEQTLIETLSDGSWSLIEGPDTSASENNYLYGVSCTSSTSCVAVGYYYASGIAQTLIETLSGGSWSITTSANNGSDANQLYSVSCSSSTSCVAVGSYYDSSTTYYQTLVETLSSGSWSLTTSPDTSASEENSLSGVSCTSSTSCVAVGFYDNGNEQTLIETLSGGSWSLTEGPDTSASEDNNLDSVSCTSSTSCVAVGDYQSTGYDQTLIETLSGGSWSLTEGPDTSASEDNYLFGVSCTSSTSCLAVGDYYLGSGIAQTLIQTLSGGSWSLTEGPDTSASEYNNLNSVSCTSSTSCVAVGDYFDSGIGDDQNLILSTPLPQTITFSPPPPTSALFGSTLTLYATGGGSGNPVVFSLDSSSSVGACYLSGTDGQIVTFTGPGSCVIDANQAGNNTYFAAPTVTVTISVTYSEPCLSLSGYHGLTVPSGQAICLSSGAVVDGSISVESGGSLDIEGARINGSVNAKGAGVVKMCGATQNGSLSVSSSAGPVIVGDDEGSMCAGNTIVGPVAITSNTAGVEFDYNSVNGPVTITGNTGSVPPPDTGSVVAVGDTVAGTESIQ
jgi:hypothetical protein